jgi:MinD-like ATPase involved in chromosome partitioning or flagellar assembly
MTSVALALPLADEQRLVAEAGRHGHRVVARCSGADDLAAQLETARPELAVAAAAPQYLSSRVVAACDAIGVRLLVVAGSVQERRFAATLGVVDPVDAPFEWAARRSPRAEPSFEAPTAAVATDSVVDEDTRVRPVRGVTPAVPSAPAASRPPATEQSPRRGRVVAVWGPEGAPGRTSLAIALAAELADARPDRAAVPGSAGRDTVIALADADTHAAAIAPALGLLDEAPGFAAACRLAGSGALDTAQFERIAQPHRAGRGDIQVLTGLGRASRWPELTADRIAGVLTAVRGWADVTVVDVAAGFERDEELMTDLNAPRRNAATIEVLRSADLVVAVGAADPIGLSRFLRAHAELAELVEPDRVLTVINKLRSSAIGLNPAAQVRQTLARFGGIEAAVLVPWDPSGFDAALLSGRALLDAAPRSAARAAVRELAARVRALANQKSS